MQSTNPQNLPFARGPRVAIYGLIAVVLLTAIVLVMLAHDALA